MNIIVACSTTMVGFACVTNCMNLERTNDSALSRESFHQNLVE